MALENLIYPSEQSPPPLRGAADPYAQAPTQATTASSPPMDRARKVAEDIAMLEDLVKVSSPMVLEDVAPVAAMMAESSPILSQATLPAPAPETPENPEAALPSLEDAVDPVRDIRLRAAGRDQSREVSRRVASQASALALAATETELGDPGSHAERLAQEIQALEGVVYPRGAAPRNVEKQVEAALSQVTPVRGSAVAVADRSQSVAQEIEALEQYIYKEGLAAHPKSQINSSGCPRRSAFLPSVTH